MATKNTTTKNQQQQKNKRKGNIVAEKVEGEKNNNNTQREKIGNHCNAKPDTLTLYAPVLTHSHIQLTVLENTYLPAVFSFPKKYKKKIRTAIERNEKCEKQNK